MPKRRAKKKPIKKGPRTALFPPDLKFQKEAAEARKKSGAEGRKRVEAAIAKEKRQEEAGEGPTPSPISGAELAARALELYKLEEKRRREEPNMFSNAEILKFLQSVSPTSAEAKSYLKALTDTLGVSGAAGDVLSRAYKAGQQTWKSQKMRKK
jgi:hypothetical protein